MRKWSWQILMVVVSMALPLWALATILAPVTLKQLFSAADQVLLVRVVEGRILGSGKDTCGARYVGAVERSFKGTSKGSRVEFGPYHQLQLGVFYLVFLSKSITPYESFISTNSMHDAARAEYAKQCKDVMAPFAIMHSGAGAMIVDDGDLNVDNWIVNWSTLITLPESVKVKETKTNSLVTIGAISIALKQNTGDK